MADKVVAVFASFISAVCFCEWLVGLIAGKMAFAFMGPDIVGLVIVTMYIKFTGRTGRPPINSRWANLACSAAARWIGFGCVVFFFGNLAFWEVEKKRGIPNHHFINAEILLAMCAVLSYACAIVATLGNDCLRYIGIDLFDRSLKTKGGKQKAPKRGKY